MLLEALWDEIKYQFKNITFYGVLFCILLMFFTELGIPKAEDFKLHGQSNKFYKTEKITDEKEEMQHMYIYLFNDDLNGKIKKYILGFSIPYKMNKGEKNELKKAMDKIFTYDINNNLQIKVTYEEYLKTINTLDKDLGGNTIYGDKYRNSILNKSISPERARIIYDEIRKKDKFTGAYGRLFADCMGITAAIFPVFLSAFIIKRERKRYKTLNFQYVLGKYIGINICLFLCYFTLAIYATAAYSYLAPQSQYIIDKAAIFKYTFTWIAPTVLFSTALGMFTSEIFKSGILAIVLQIIMSFLSITPLQGDYKLWKFVIRFNVFGGYDKYIEWKPMIIANRIFITLISFIIISVTAYVCTSSKRNIS